MKTMCCLEIHCISKHYSIKDSSVKALQNFSLTVKEGEFITVVGKSGCGKTTLLRLICGLENTDGGRITFTSHNEMSHSKKVGIVFQEPRLMPWLTVRQNIVFAVRDEKNRQRKMHLVDELLETLGLTAFQDAYPWQVSGGMAQRTALGRTLCFDPDIILMDEPFGALDAFTRRNLQQELVRIFLSRNKTIIFVTHDVDEALLLGQRLLVMEVGTIIRDLPIDLPYPRDTLSRDFFILREDVLRTILEP
jgi:sulfonate transport system ATP-binding protein